MQEATKGCDAATIGSTNNRTCTSTLIRFAEKLCGICALLAGLLLLRLLVASPTVIADSQSADLHVRSIGEALRQLRSSSLAATTCWRAVAGALAWLTLPASLMLRTAVDTAR